ncbi:GntR family transcriptional regulator [Rubrobacter xylanophilus]|nr:GntR family transcriptional regulator [Rubrobacter xylanophilus]
MVADGLREGILRGVLKAGQPLRQMEIAEQFGVSSIPVREALRQLEGEGLMVFYPRRGAVVSELSRDEVLEICEMREVLELLALRKAFPNLTEGDLQRAEEVLERADAQTDEELLGMWGEVNWEFHSALYRPANRPQLLGVIRNLHNRFDRYLRIHFSALDYRVKGQQEHWEILERCKRGDEGRALEELRRHILTVKEMLLEYLDGEAEEDDAP